jgi:hypothetical protein
MRSQTLGDVVAADAVFAFRCRASRSTDESTESCIGLPIFDEHDESEAVYASELTADEQLQR